MLTEKVRSFSAANSRYFARPLGVTDNAVYLEGTARYSSFQKLLQINEITADKIREFLLGVVSMDGCAGRGAYFTRNQGVTVPLLFNAWLGLKKAFIDQVTQNLKTGEIETAKVGTSDQHNFLMQQFSDGIGERESLLIYAGLSVPVGRYSGYPPNRERMLIRANKEKSVYYIHLSALFGEKDRKIFANSKLRDIFYPIS